jgi:hypothetical protein
MAAAETITAGKVDASPKKLLSRRSEIKRSLKKRGRTPSQIAEFMARLNDIDLDF